MITPRFQLSQDDFFLTITIRAPYCNLRELDIDVDRNNFIFVCKPYYLRLSLPGIIMDDSRMRSSFNADLGLFQFIYSKHYPGEHFKDLDLITKLLTPKVQADYNDGSIPIEVLSVSEPDHTESQKELNIKGLDFGFGFAMRAHKDFVKISSEFDEVLEIDPCQVSLQDRRKFRLQYEQGKFNVDHYLADFIEDSEICEILAQKCHFSKFTLLSKFTFTDSELDFLKDLPNIHFDLCEDQIEYCQNGLVDILFAYCYDQRTTFFEGNVESGWTIVKIAATLCWLDGFRSPQEVLTAAFRRALIYPLYRHFDLCQTVFEDLKILLSLDERYIIRALIQIYNIFLKGDSCRYILNNLFIKDYIVYAMKWDPEEWRKFVNKVINTQVKKDDLGLNLSEIECFNLAEKLAAMKMKEVESDSDDTDYCSTEDSSEDSSTSEYSSDSDSDSDVDSRSATTLEKKVTNI